jgi:hypothetical protein
MQWRTVRRIDGATEGAVAFAVARGWLVEDASRRVALTEVGRQLAEELGRPLH